MKYFINSKETMATIEIFDSLAEAIEYLEHHGLCCLTIMKTARDKQKERGYTVNGAINEAVRLLEILPESEQDFAVEIIRKLVLAWDANADATRDRE